MKAIYSMIFKYELPYLQPIKSTVTNSKGTLLITKMTQVDLRKSFITLYLSKLMNMLLD